MDNNDHDLINSQIFIDALFIVSLLISVYLLYHRKDNRPGTMKIRYFNRILFIVIYTGIIWVAYKSYKRSNHPIDFMAYVAGIISLIPPLIYLYLFKVATDEHIDNVKNPNI